VKNLAPYENLEEWRAELRDKTPLEVIEWVVAQCQGQAIVSTNFRPYEAVILHMCVQVQPDMPVLWVDHGFNRPATYRHLEQLRKRLRLNLRPYLPMLSAAHYEAVYGPAPEPGDERALQEFSARMKLEPFQRGMRELAPRAWITALRRTQAPSRAGTETLSWDATYSTLKVSPLLEFSDDDMERYLRQHGLPNEWDYFDPAKADDKRECGLHSSWGAGAVTALKTAESRQ
jgi:phosphoadenosine phosphosulfate reductase